MKKLLVACAVVTAFYGSLARADDAAPNNSWDGCSVGVNAGYGGARTEIIDLGYPPPLSLGSHSANGMVGGGQIGCDSQTGAWVFGIQGMLDAVNFDDRHVIPQNPNTAYETKTSWFGTLTGRIGYATRPTTLFYAKGGISWARQKEDQERMGTDFDTGFLTAKGWSAGAGFEHLFAPKLSSFAEYDYMSFENSNPLPNVNEILFKRNAQTVLFGVKYHFGRPAASTSKPL